MKLSWIGQILLWLGFLAGATASVWQLEVADDKWSTIDWRVYGLAAVVSAIGATILRLEKSWQRKESASDSSGWDSMEAALQGLSKTLNHLSSALKQKSCEQAVAYIDEQCVPKVAEFVDSRHLIVNRLGTGTYARVMTEFASGERYMNRAWSAAADGYVDEVARSVDLAAGFMMAAVEELSKASKGQASE